MVKLLNLINPIRSVIEPRLYRALGLDQKLLNLKDKHKGETMLIVGNGPSLNETPLENFLHLPSIGMNKINMLFHRVSWRPNYIVSTNGLVIKQNRFFFNKTDITSLLSFKGKFMNVGNQNNAVTYFLERNELIFSKEPVKNGFGLGGTVTFIALQFAYFMGVKNVIIVGVDHSFSYDKKHNDNAIVKRKEDYDVNHFDPNYFAKGSRWGIPNLDKSEHSYTLAKQAFEKKGGMIYDATIGGELEIFEKITIKQALDISYD